MPFDGSGVFNRLFNWQQDAANGINIRADRMDGEMNGMAAGLSLCLTRDGQGSMTANLNMGNKQIVNLLAATADSDAVSLGQANINFVSKTGTGLGAWGNDMPLLADFDDDSKSGFYRWNNTSTLNFPIAGGGMAIPFNRSGTEGEEDKVWSWLASLSTGASGSALPRFFIASTGSAIPGVLSDWAELVSCEPFSATNTGVKFREGIKIGTPGALHNGVTKGQINFIADAGNPGVYDIDVLDAPAASRQRIRFFANTLPGTIGDLWLCQPGTNTPKSFMDTDGRIGGIAVRLTDGIGIGYLPDSTTLDANTISVEIGNTLRIAGGVATAGAVRFYDVNNAEIARVGDATSAASTTLTIITRIKGDLRYALKTAFDALEARVTALE